MSYQLVLTQKNAEGAKDVGNNVFLGSLPVDCKVYAFYYPGSMPDRALEDKLQSLGHQAGSNLFVNIGRLNDPQFNKIVKAFNIRKYPVIIVTATSALAADTDKDQTLYARLDGEHLLESPDRTIQCIEELFNLFIQGKVSEAIARAKSEQRQAALGWLGRTVTDSLKSVLSFITEADISISLLEGRFEIKRSGD